MKKRIFAGITASILALSCAAQVPAILSASAAGNYEMQLNIKLNGEKKAISPYIYGVNEAGNSTSLKKVTTHSLGKAAIVLLATTGKIIIPMPVRTGTIVLTQTWEM